MNQIVDATKMVKPISECTTVAELLEDPARWTKKTSARNRAGYSAGPKGLDACCWCLRGAITRIYSDHPTMLMSALEKVHQLLPGVESLENWNDDSTHAEVLELVRRAGI